MATLGTRRRAAPDRMALGARPRRTPRKRARRRAGARRHRRAAPAGRRSAAAMTPGVAVADLLGSVALLQLTERMADRGKRHFDASLLQRSADVRRRDRARRGRAQDLADDLRIGPALRAAPARPSPAGGAT